MGTDYPLVGFYFKLEISGDATDVASFQEVSGISTETETNEIAEGGENRFKHKVPTGAKYNNLILKRGILVNNSVLSAWCQDTIQSDFSNPINPKAITVSLVDQNGTTQLKWEFINAWPVKLNVSNLKPQGGDLIIESLELAYSYFQKIAG